MEQLVLTLFDIDLMSLAVQANLPEAFDKGHFVMLDALF